MNEEEMIYTIVRLDERIKRLYQDLDCLRIYVDREDIDGGGHFWDEAVRRRQSEIDEVLDIVDWD